MGNYDIIFIIVKIYKQSFTKKFNIFKLKRFRTVPFCPKAKEGLCLESFYLQNLWFPIITVKGLDQIHLFVAVLGLK